MRYRNSIWAFLPEATTTVLGRVLILLAQFLGIKALSSLMTLDEYGRLSLLISGLTIANLLFYGPFGQAASRFLSISIRQGEFRQYEQAVWRIFGGSIKRIGQLSIGITFVFLVAGQGRQLLTIWLMAVLACADAFNSSLVAGLLNADRKRMWAVIVDLLDKARYGVAALVIYLWDGSYVVVLASFATLSVGLAALNGYLYKTQFATYRSAHSSELLTDYRQSLLRYSQPFMVWGLFAWGQTFLERYMLDVYQSMADVAAYAIINQFGFQTVSLGGAMLMQLVSPVLFAETKSQEVSGKMYYLLSGFGLLMAVILSITAVWSTEIMTLLTSPAYSVYAKWLPWMMLSGALFTVGQLASMSLLIDLEPRRLLLPKIGTACLEICLLLVSVRAYGLRGVIGSSLVANAVYAVWLVGITKSKLRRYELVH
ncbi:lipopolysaccharide biosynthesis protein [Spirosoma terrae]|uniref:Oligosaccharide flippase family protein n=1 Tax=Spirosoma terrae TaxID=1968276 RepID=A0A6L9LQL4_9BACT|nr:hypothetical protein [Spirosoma terrae]NDU99259.1 hypothetical protein [Spirosoma terrae]